MSAAVSPRDSLRALRAVVAVLVAISVGVTGMQQLSSEGPWWLELSRYLPSPVLLLLPFAALLMSMRLARRWIAASLVASALVAVFAMDLAWRGAMRPSAGDSNEVVVRVMTYNVKAGNAHARPGGIDALAREVERQRPDVLVMQDAHPLLRGRAPDSRAPIFGLPELFLDGQYIVASRYPLRDCSEGRLNVGEEPLVFVRCAVDAPGLPFQLVTTHFASPRWGLEAARRGGLDGVDSWQRNHDARLAQARGLAVVLARAPRPLVLAGDLNAPESSAVIRSLLAIGLRDAFSSAGVGYGFTYGHTRRPAFSFLRIDHILVSPDLAVRECFAGGEDASEHRPVIADLRPPR